MGGRHRQTAHIASNVPGIFWSQQCLASGGEETNRLNLWDVLSNTLYRVKRFSKCNLQSATLGQHRPATNCSHRSVWLAALVEILEVGSAFGSCHLAAEETHHCCERVIILWNDVSALVSHLTCDSWVERLLYYSACHRGNNGVVGIKRVEGCNSGRSPLKRL